MAHTNTSAASPKAPPRLRTRSASCVSANGSLLEPTRALAGPAPGWCARHNRCNAACQKADTHEWTHKAPAATLGELFEHLVIDNTAKASRGFYSLRRLLARTRGNGARAPAGAPHTARGSWWLAHHRLT